MSSDPLRQHSDTSGKLLLWLLIFLRCAIEGTLQLADLRILAPKNLRNLTYETFAFWPFLLTGGTPRYSLQPLLMFGTYSFLHADLTHLFFNMIAHSGLRDRHLRRHRPLRAAADF